MMGQTDRHRPGWHRPGWHRPGWHRPGWHRPGWHRRPAQGHAGVLFWLALSLLAGMLVLIWVNVLSG